MIETSYAHKSSAGHAVLADVSFTIDDQGLSVFSPAADAGPSEEETCPPLS